MKDSVFAPYHFYPDLHPVPNILAIETSVPAATIALKIGIHPLLLEGFESHRQQNQLLFAPLKSLLSHLPEGEQIDLIIIGTGPGSYSGSRISIAAAQGIAAAHSCPVVGQSSFLATEKGLEETPSFAVGDARRGAYFTSNLPAKGLPSDPVLMPREEFDDKITHLDSAAIFTLEPELLFANGSPIPLQIPSAAHHIAAWERLSLADQASQLNTPPAPTYLRAPFITKAKPGHPLLRGKIKSRE